MSTERFCLLVLGRLHGITRERLRRAVQQEGGRLVSKASARVTLVGIGHGTASAVLAHAPPLTIPAGLPAARAISEINLKRLLGLHPQHPEESRDMSAADLGRAARLDLEVVRCLALYDVLDPRADRFGYRDLVAAREVRRLLDLGLALAQIVEAAVTLRRSGRRLSDTRLGEAPWGEVVQEVAGRLGRLNGQYTLPLEEGFETVDEVFQRAEEAELQGNLASAARHYGIALRMDPADPVIPFNLGNVLDAAGDAEQAAIAYQRAIARDPSFAEAWLNLAVLHEQRGDSVKAEACYMGAIEARPDYADALHNLALLLTRRELFVRAIEIWERYLALRPKPADTPKALKVLALCRVAARAPTARMGQAGSGG